MPLSAEDIRASLAAFVERWHGYGGGERAEAQPFLIELLACYGTDRREAGARFEQRSGSGFMDMIWPGVCIVEMKRPSEASRLAEHRGQTFDYWKEVSRATGNAGRFVVVCAFGAFEVFEPGSFWDKPVATFTLEELPERHEALAFLGGKEPRFEEDRAELTREAVALVTDLFARLGARRAAEAETLRDFVLQCVWCMFAEDLRMIPDRRFTRIVEGLVSDRNRSSEDDLGGLFGTLNRSGSRPEHGLYAGVPYADGGLFAAPARVYLEAEELELLREACRYDWHHVEPAIFGALLQGTLGRERQWAFGAHYTSEADIRKIVEPTVVEPWRERVDGCESVADAEAEQNALMQYVVLDPACGSGNFLYVAYRELRRIEAALRARVDLLRASAGLSEQGTLGFFPITNMKGIELEPFAVKLARVTLWMGHKLAVEELALPEAVLPLADLSGIRRADALRVEWPRADAIIGNPPYHGSQQIRSELGDEYTEWLRHEFGIGLKDFAVYWFRKAHGRLEPGGRAGLVATNSISQNRNRRPSLEWVIENGGVITSAVSKLPWSGEAVVNVSIVNWTKEPTAPPTRIVLDGVDVSGISAALRPAHLDVASAKRLLNNRGRAFQGPIPADGGGFILTREEAEDLLALEGADYKRVVRPYLTSDDIGDQPEQQASRFVIDFGFLPLEDAGRFPVAIDIVRERVRPYRERNRDARFRKFWWQFGRPRRALREALAPLSRYIAGTRHGNATPLLLVRFLDHGERRDQRVRFRR